MSGCIALIVAAGRGQRLGGGLPKQYREIGGKPLIRRAVEAFAGHPAIAGVRVVIHPDDRELYESAMAGLALLPPVAGGETRQDSSRLGLASLAELAPDRVLIHDAARPFVDRGVIDRTVAALEAHPAALAALPVVDTLKRQNGQVVGATLARDGLWRAQTPQGFRYAEIVAAHEAAHEGAAAAGAAGDLTDDAAVAERAGLPVALVMGSEDNFKVTTEADLERAERLFGAGPFETRTGLGFDVHRFGPGDHVMLCGVRLEHSHGLVGHSDADVGLHALTDALLGAIGAGDIGSHFPPGEAEWRDAPSEVFLRHAGALVGERGGVIAGLDLTLICEAPRIRPHHAALVARVAEILGIAPGRVSIKATTTEGLGFTGRGEGIAAQAVASVRLPLRAQDAS